MSDRTWTRRIALTAAAGGFALALAAAPLAPGGEFPGFTPSAVLAKGGGDNGADHSGGRGGGNGHGKGGLGGSAPGQVISTSAVGGEDGPGHGHGLALGHDKDAVSGVQGGGSVLHPENHGVISSMLGSLNAAHAIANGNTNDNLNSKVGQISAYMESFNTGDIPAAAEDLIAASNRDLESLDTDTVEDVVGGVNDLLGTNAVELGTNAVELGTNVVENEAREREVAETISPPPE